MAAASRRRGAHGGALLAADSWLVADGAVRGLDAHWGRFGGWCSELGVARDELAALPRRGDGGAAARRGRWFPRVDARPRRGRARGCAPPGCGCDYGPRRRRPHGACCSAIRATRAPGRSGRGPTSSGCRPARARPSLPAPTNCCCATRRAADRRRAQQPAVVGGRRALHDACRPHAPRRHARAAARARPRAGRRGPARARRCRRSSRQRDLARRARCTASASSRAWEPDVPEAGRAARGDWQAELDALARASTPRTPTDRAPSSARSLHDPADRAQPPPCLRTASRRRSSSFTSSSWRRRMSSMRRSTLVPTASCVVPPGSSSCPASSSCRGLACPSGSSRAGRRRLVRDSPGLDVAQRLGLGLRVAVVVEDRDELVRLGVDDDRLRHGVGAVGDDRRQVDEAAPDEHRPRLDDAEVARARASRRRSRRRGSTPP